ncbi:MAG: N-acetylglucosamine-6-phosphate deacetylase [Armatimonadetes bacterium]|nr:N-acetylglucosamine-6-phosphate deacetylase [Armatimonadota bacterium]
MTSHNRTASSTRWVLQADTLLLPEGTVSPGFVVIEGESIAQVEEGLHPSPDLTHPDSTVAPGFVDLQINGAAGCDFLRPSEAGLAAAHAYLLATGTVAYLPTLISAPEAQLREALSFFAARMDAGGVRGAPRILGVHLEGPFLSPERPGAHRSEHLRPPSVEWIGRLVDDFRGLIRIVTLAPELDGALEVIRYLNSQGIVAAIGHTNATFDEAMAAFDAGARLATHLFNAMPPYHHREPGVVGAALADGRVTCSVVADLVHVHPAVLAQVAVLKGWERTALVTDAIAAAGADQAGMTLGDQTVTVADGAPRLAGGKLAGSILRMDRAVRNMAEAIGAWDQAARMASTTPARLLGLEQGDLRAGLRADLAVLSKGRAVGALIVGGRVVTPGGAGGALPSVWGPRLDQLDHSHRGQFRDLLDQEP